MDGERHQNQKQYCSISYHDIGDLSTGKAVKRNVNCMLVGLYERAFGYCWCFFCLVLEHYHHHSHFSSTIAIAIIILLLFFEHLHNLLKNHLNNNNPIIILKQQFLQHHCIFRLEWLLHIYTNISILSVLRVRRRLVLQTVHLSPGTYHNSSLGIHQEWWRQSLLLLLLPQGFRLPWPFCPVPSIPCIQPLLDPFYQMRFMSHRAPPESRATHSVTHPQHSAGPTPGPFYSFLHY